MAVTPISTHVEKEPAQFNNQVIRLKQPAKLTGSLTTVQLAEVAQDYTHPKVSIPAVASSGGDIETIVRQAARKYGIDENYFVRIVTCESHFHPDSVNYNYWETSSDGMRHYPSGLFQHLTNYWPARAVKYGWPGASVFDAQANAEVTAQMFRDGLSNLWECK